MNCEDDSTATCTMTVGTSFFGNVISSGTRAWVSFILGSNYGEVTVSGPVQECRIRDSFGDVYRHC